MLRENIDKLEKIFWSFAQNRSLLFNGGPVQRCCCCMIWQMSPNAVHLINQSNHKPHLFATAVIEVLSYAWKSVQGGAADRAGILCDTRGGALNQSRSLSEDDLHEQVRLLLKLQKSHRVLHALHVIQHEVERDFLTVGQADWCATRSDEQIPYRLSAKAKRKMNAVLCAYVCWTLVYTWCACCKYMYNMQDISLHYRWYR